LRRTRAIARLVTILLAVPVTALAQDAFTPPAGSGTISVSFQAIKHTGHRLTDGSYFDSGRSKTAAATADVEYGITRRWSVAFTLPYVFARYTGTDVPPDPLPFLPVDSCHCWQSGWQDFGFMTRFNMVDTFDHVLVITPFLSAGTPANDYAYQGEAVIGRHLNELRVGTDASYRVDAISHRLTVSGRYTYTFVEEVIGVSTNRSNVRASADVRVARALSVGGFAAWQRLHGGLRTGSFPPSDLPIPGEINTLERLLEHDRLLRDNNFHLGANVSYGFRHADVFGSFIGFVSGTDTHAGHAGIVGVSVPFNLRR
jgi:hypothetical protein